MGQLGRQPCRGVTGHLTSLGQPPKVAAQHWVIDKGLWRPVMRRELHFIIRDVDVPVAVPAQVHTPTQCAAAKVCCETTPAVDFFRYQVMKRQR